MINFKNYKRNYRANGDSDIGSDNVLLLIGPFIIAYFLVCVCFGQTYPEAVPNTALYGVYTAPPNAMPDYLEVFNANLSSSTIRRISDPDVLGVDGQRVRHNYSKDQTFNSDETLIKLAGYPAAIIDAQTYAFLYWSNIPGYGRWSNTQPNIVYGTSGNQFQMHDVYTNTRTTLHVFTDYTSIDFGYGEGNQDIYDRYVGLIGRHVNGQRHLIVYNIQTDTVVGVKTISASASLDWFSVSQRGAYAVAVWQNDGPGVTEGVKSYDITLQNEQHIYNNTGHGDLGIDAAGNEVFVAYGYNSEWQQNHSMFMVRLDGTGSELLFPYVDGLGIWGGHVSTRNINRPGWAYVSEQCCSSNPVAARELFAIKLDASGTVERYAKHHAQPGNYLHETQLVPNRNGTKIVFSSNWSDPDYTSQPAALDFVLEVNQNTLTLPEHTAVNYPYTLQYFDITGRELLKTIIYTDLDFNAVKERLKLFSAGVYVQIKTANNNVEQKQIIIQ